MVDRVKHNTAIDKVHKEEEKDSKSAQELYSKLTRYRKIVQRLTALCVSFNCTALDPTLGNLKNQGKISQFSAATCQLPKMRRQIYPKEFLRLVSCPASYCDRKVCL